MNHIDNLSINAIRVLSADAIQKAKSGHPGLPLGAAPIAYELWAHHMNHNPANPDWRNRDRFILSGGHGSMLLYSLLYLYRYGDMTLDDLKEFRRLDSKTPGHPEYRHTVGVEATTGPLGAGMGMAVGMAIAEKHLASVFNKEGYPVIDHYTYALGGDGCMMEGISSEAFSLAGTLGLSKLIILYDSNNISIEGSTDIAFTEDVQKRMESFGFQTLEVADGNDIDAVGKAIEEAKADTEHPSFITIHTEIGYGCPNKQGKASAHGEPLGEENVKEMKETLGWTSQEPFYVPDEVYAHYKELRDALAEKEEEWNKMYAEYCEKFPEMKELMEQYFECDCEAILKDNEEFWKRGEKPEATRAISGRILNTIKDSVPNLMGGSADLAPSNKTYLNDKGDFSADCPSGRNMHFGVRELAMGAIGNGMMLHGGLHSYVATFFVFSDYIKPMARLSSIMKVPMTYVYSHDSIGVGEDGPTHEPIEQLAMFRAMPNFHVFRPCDAVETEAAWYSALTSKETPTAIVLTRQNLAPMAGSSKDALKGGYILEDCEGTPDMILIATGSEVELAAGAKSVLEEKGKKVRLVSMPCVDIFEEQTDEYKERVLPKDVTKRVSVEALSTFGWDRYVGPEGKAIGMTTFGASGPYKTLFEFFGFTVDAIVEAAESL
ncbi:transketolase [[Clostridium] scindens ATCC 35704]|uniref:Transketolase n=1 Tax=Clostridium scindens (strain ATCC 35704 / DSM 5676 / VPI 13733 / 19) TaxID=411468 RepID=B0NJZ3_CLOS5|nr:transketolase [[Clostridium] scindens]EDS05220.1 transketolase [[Clostridium] scindens ATCC 35704]QBF74282.1 Transketolase [[Clostridium] scindens ATCC 35704]QRO37538.1 transketolase [[Clostridium] scindens]WPB36995.1 Transketolase [[Clostridium] scindens]BDF15219.1 transketolase [[Clostridium] scindens]